MSVSSKVTDSKKMNSMQISARFSSTVEKFVEKQKVNDFGVTEEELIEFYNTVKSTPPASEPTEKAPKAEKVIKEPKVKAEKAPKEPKAPKVPKEKVERNASDVKIEGKLLEIFESTTIAKSDKFRQLHAEGVSIGQITRLFDSHYSFVKSAVTRELKPEGEKKTPGKKKEVVEAPVAVVEDQGQDSGVTTPSAESESETAE